MSAPLPDHLTENEKIAFIENLLEEIKWQARRCVRSGQMPENWGGAEMRLLVATIATDEDAITTRSVRRFRGLVREKRGEGPVGAWCPWPALR